MRSVLIVDDERSVGELIGVSLRSLGLKTEYATTVGEASLLLEHRKYDAMVCDVNLNGDSGIALLDYAKSRSAGTAVVVISGSAGLPVATDVMRNGAYDFLAKPFTPEQLRTSVSGALEKRDARLLEEQRHRELESLVRSRTAELQDALGATQRAYDLTIEALGAALDLRDSETEEHCRNVAAISLGIAAEYGVTDADELQDLRWGALLHDIGKIGIPDAILRKPGPLTDDERAIINTHPGLGYRMVSGIGFLHGASAVVRHHHERFDGTGYPDGLVGHDIPRTARIFAVADAVDVLTKGRVYQSAISFASVREEIARSAGTHFDPRAVEAFLAMEKELEELTA